MSERYECFCGAGWFTKDQLVEHVKEEHPEIKYLNVCQACDKAFRDYNEAKEHVLGTHDVYCDECQDKYIYDAFEQIYYFTIEHDVPIAAFSEQDAEYKFKQKYPGIPILGVIRPTSIVNGGKRRPKYNGTMEDPAGSIQRIQEEWLR